MPVKHLSTAKIARACGCHPNTVRLYEQIGFIAPVPRSPNGYRLYTEEHLDQMRLARKGMEGAWPGHKIRHAIFDLVKSAAGQDYRAALDSAQAYLQIVQSERRQAEAAADVLESWARVRFAEEVTRPLLVHEAASLLDVTVDMLRNWERSGLVSVPRSPLNCYRQYHASEVGRLRVIRLLRQVGYSPMAILRMLVQLDQGTVGSLRTALDTPRPDEDVYTAFDHWLSTLAEQEDRAREMIAMVEAMLEKYDAARAKETGTV